MPAKSMRAQMRGPYVPMADHRSVSGSSTESHASSLSVPQDHANAFVHDDRKYAPIRPSSQPPHHGFANDAMMHAGPPGLPDEHAGLRQIQQFTHGPHTPIDGSFGGFHQQAQYAPHNAMPQQHHHQHHPQYHAISEGPPDVAMMHMPHSMQQQHHHHHQHRDSMSQMGGTDNESRPKRAINSNAANERELRELIESNAHRSLESIAKEVRSAEKSQKAERAKQLFAMRWLKQFCKADKESVPRSKVYTHYTQRCGTERVDTLNPASFGKLVRVIFPGIATRRLGVRGESKYHYVNLTLIEDPQTMMARPASRQGSAERVTPIDPELARPSVSKFTAEPAPDSHTGASFASRFETAGGNPPSMGLLFAEPTSQKLRHDGDGPQTYTQCIRFSSASNNATQDDTMSLPDIHPFLPEKADEDLAQSLTALYRTHCTSLIDAVRYVREKQFNKVLNAYNGTMTVPVTKLFDHPSVAPWIKACDWYMYQQIIKFVSQLALQVIPPQVFTMLGNLSNNLATNLKNSFKQRPNHVLQAKLEPAVMFASLLQRLLRVNETAHAAANLLTNDEMRNGMWQDWVKSVRPKRVLESELPTCGHEETYQILTTEVRQLLEPLQSTDDIESGTDYEGATLSALQTENPFATTINSSAENIIDRWATFLRALPARFPRVSTRTLLHYASSVSTAALRDITVNQAGSFGGWWITKVWVDEMMLWQAEMGGFLDMIPGAPATKQSSDESQDLDKQGQSTRENAQDERADNTYSAPHSAGLGNLDFSTMPSFTPMQDSSSKHINGASMSPFKSPSKMNPKHDSLAFDFDDSGIGMSLTDQSPSRLFMSNGLPGTFMSR